LKGENLQFKNAKFENYTSKMEETGPVYRLHVTADATTDIANQMGWDILDDAGAIRGGMKGVKLEGALVIGDFTLTPNEKALQSQALALAGSEIRSFQVTTKREDGHKSASLRFVLTTPGPITKIDKYWRSVRMADAELQVAVVEQKSFDDDPEDTADAEEQAQFEEMQEEEKPKRGRQRKDRPPADER
jgi:hypothetical protein